MCRALRTGVWPRQVMVRTHAARRARRGGCPHTAAHTRSMQEAALRTHHRRLWVACVRQHKARSPYMRKVHAKRLRRVACRTHKHRHHVSRSTPVCQTRRATHSAHLARASFGVAAAACVALLSRILCTRSWNANVYPACTATDEATHAQAPYIWHACVRALNALWLHHRPCLRTPARHRALWFESLRCVS